LGGFVVEAVAALSILCYLAFLYFDARWNRSVIALMSRWK
jgi:hypothetical protein